MSGILHKAGAILERKQDLEGSSNDGFQEPGIRTRLNDCTSADNGHGEPSEATSAFSDDVDVVKNTMNEYSKETKPEGTTDSDNRVRSFADRMKQRPPKDCEVQRPVHQDRLVGL